MSPTDSLQSILDSLEAAVKERGYEFETMMVTPKHTRPFTFWPALNGVSQKQVSAPTLDELLAQVKALADPVDELASEILKTEAKLQKLKAQRDGRA